MATDTRQDLHQTSTGVGHHWRPGYYFPSSNFKVRLVTGYHRYDFISFKYTIFLKWLTSSEISDLIHPLS